jgi:hypothetical protein
MFTSKAGGCVHRWRVSRHIWRTLADYNQMSGVTTAKWGRPTRQAVMFSYKKDRRNWFNFDGYRDIKYLDRNSNFKFHPFKLN